MRLSFGCSAVLIGVFLQGGIVIASTTMSSITATIKNNGTSGTDKVGTTQNYSTTATTVNGSESLTTTHSPSSATTIHEANSTTTELANLTTTHGEISNASSHIPTSHFTENVTSMITNTATPGLTTGTASNMTLTSALLTASTTNQKETTDYLSTITAHSPTTSVDTKVGSRFDLASFLGGIVLALGLCVITVFGYRCYKNRKSSAPPYRIVDE